MRTLVMAGFAALVLTACNQNKTEEQQGETATTSMNTPEPTTIDVKLADLGSPKDLYCGMDIVEGSIADTASYKDKLYAFCAHECKDSFMVNPEKYLAQK